MKIKAFWAIVGLLAILLTVASCSKKQLAQPPTETQTTQTDTKPAQPETPVEPKQDAPRLTDAQLQTVYFDFDRYTLRSEAKMALDANAAMLKQFPNARIQIEGHCDERGTVEYNLSLGEKRARSCVEYLTGLGIDAARLSVISFGEERPAVSGSNEEAWAKNRRAEFKVTSDMPM